ncbi:AraC family transcriptional regulator [Comamonas serinivorans]|uniref:AraC family transcriptional regulator n=1 Tax=Comamonas serinivorans TaxID=1082851 RepID=A0A1Y0EID7_9BURK|nr:helix-turn-helix transcriptional regulator [Comamonas serinivorans]ARU03367.1 AraC family transcriptional regulator [Comamonas serinivorans]
MPDPMVLPSQAADPRGPLLRAVVRRSGAVRVTRRHRHARGQLLGAEQGLLSVDAGSRRWVVPATHAVWIPPDVPHGLRSHGPFSGWSVYVAAFACLDLPGESCVLAVPGLLREAVVRAASWTGDVLDGPQARLAGVILDEIRSSQHAALGLPMPQDARLLRVAQALSDRPDDGRLLVEWAEWAGIAPRTLTRRFVTDTGFTFTEWRQRVRLLKALELLAAGRPVKAVALDLGYGNVSAFIAMFRQILGFTPGQYEALMR